MRALALTWTIPIAFALPLTIQSEQEVKRERFTFIGTSLEIEVAAEVPGALRLIQGQDGEIVVTARAVSGVAGAGLSGLDPGLLQLSAVGADRVEYLVAVPAGAQVRIRLPDRPVAETLGTLQRTAVYTWGTDAAELPGGGDR
jgi:hypothetical protein